MSRKSLIAVAAVVVLIAAVVIVVVTVTDEGSADADCRIPRAANGPVTRLRPSAQLRVADHGFSQDGSNVSMGAVVKNTSALVAYRTRVSFTVEASRGDAPKATLKSVRETEIPVILPGQQVGVGRGLVVSWGQATNVTTNLETTHWLPKRTLGTFSQPMTRYRSTSHAPGQPAVVTYSETSRNCRALTDRNTAVIFRDKDDAIVGGAIAAPDGRTTRIPGQKSPSSPSCSPGSRTTWMAPGSVPSRADDQRTGVYSYCDVAAEADDVNAVP